MAWYYYSGTIVRPIQVKKGLSKSVRPKSKIEILDLTAEAQALIRKQQLRITSKPKGVASVKDTTVPDGSLKDFVKRSDLANRIAEKGRTTSRTIPPVSVSGADMTEGEMAALDRSAERGGGEDGGSGDEKKDDDAEKSSGNDVVGSEEVDQAGELNDNQGRKKLRRRRN